jgi:hypothetical protein
VGANPPLNVALELHKITAVGVGDCVGDREGEPDGLVGFLDGFLDGFNEGFFDGLRDGLREGFFEGLREGLRDGDRVILSTGKFETPMHITWCTVAHVCATSSTSILVAKATVPVPLLDVQLVHDCAA